MCVYHRYIDRCPFSIPKGVDLYFYNMSYNYISIYSYYVEVGAREDQAEYAQGPQLKNKD